MDITRGSLDEISKPACSSRINHGSRILSGSLEILTPEPSLTKIDYYNKQTEDDSQEHNDENGDKYGTKKMKTKEDILEQKANCSGFQLQIQNTNQVQECISSPVDSEDDCSEDKPSGCSIITRNKLAKIQAASSTKLKDSKDRDIDPLLQKAIKKMKRLDQILATKQSHEKAIKKQGRELKTKLWEEFQAMSSRSSSVTTEEVENTSRFLALTSSLQETHGPSAVEEDEVFISVFQTQIYPESSDGSGSQAKQDCLNEDRTRNSITKIENTHQKCETSCRKTPSFIKKNIELAKDSGNQIVMLEEEKKRLSELLKDTEDESSELQIIEEEATGWLVPGEGYTPEPMEYHHLAEIEAKLEIIISDGDLSTVQNSCLTVHQPIYQASLAYANRKLETVPGDKVLRDTKEERDQQNRLKEIDQQLKNLEQTMNWKRKM
ncbi:fibrous sheath-interacting protein 1 isoform X2 [Tiliqua scincoides]|uniref:fibrous sheath-interacting protein 1 isoform X2 n=1 Tax=Tiliqua scincoides TaxID=71010 RepID=UPI003461A05A